MKNKLLTAFFTCALFAMPFISKAIQPASTKSQMKATELIHQNKKFLFEENKGQLLDQTGKLLTNIKYYGKEGGVNVYCKSSMISFVFTKVENGSQQISEASSQPSGFPLPKAGSLREQGMELGFGRENIHPGAITASRIDLQFLNANPKTSITASDQTDYYENFYTTGDANHGIPNVHTYKTLTYKNIYPHIDLILNTREEGLEYSFLVHPGGKVSDIKLKWDGADKRNDLKNEGIQFCNGLGTLKESLPQSFADGKTIKSSFLKHGYYDGFKVDSYDKNKDLLIDPTLTWATYFGGSELDNGNGICIDGLDNIYMVGETTSTSGIATSGAYQRSFKGLFVACLAKFSSTGMLSWATYFGGRGVYDFFVAGQTIGSSVCTDGLGNVNITGYTRSIDSFATSGTYQTVNYGGKPLGPYNAEAFVAQFSSSGTLSWATYYGGSSGDYGTGMCPDGSGNIYITGYASSITNIASSGAYQTSYGGGIEDAFLAKFTHSGSLSWATYYGGSNDDAGTSVSTDGSGNVYLAGYTKSHSGIATAGSYQSVNMDTNYKVFIAKFNSAGSLTWGTYFGGNGIERGGGICTDVSGNVYITGGTTSSTGIATTGANKSSYAGGNDAFLAKFNSSGNISWATYFGGSGYDYGSGVCTDAIGDLYLYGYTQSDSGIASSGAYQTAYRGTGNPFLAKFSSSGTEAWATYFGGTSQDEASGLCIDAYGNIYISGTTTSTSGIATSGAYQTSYAGSEDAFIAKFHEHNSGITAPVNSDLYGLTVYPNPFTDKTLVDFNLPSSSHVKITLMDINGKVISVHADRTFSSGKNEIEINAAQQGLAPGTYFVNLDINGEVINKKIVVVK